jgi:hypothetical protein
MPSLLKDVSALFTWYYFCTSGDKGFLFHDGTTLFIKESIYAASRVYSSDYLRQGRQTMVQDLLRTIRALQNTAIGNSRKRIEKAAQKPKKSVDNDATETGTSSNHEKPIHGVTSILKDKYGL